MIEYALPRLHATQAACFLGNKKGASVQAEAPFLLLKIG
jgi:hypothetical protein